MKLEYQNLIYETIAEKKEDGSLAAKINNEILKYKFFPITENIYRIVSDQNKNQILYLSSDDEKYYAFLNGQQIELQKYKEKDFEINKSEDSLNKLILKPPMPGSIVKVEVAVGQEVSEGDPLIIVEAMKMETTLYSSISGIVTEVNVKAGEQVPADKILIVVEKNRE